MDVLRLPQYSFSPHQPGSGLSLSHANARRRNVSLSQNGTGAKPAIEESSANTGPTAHARTAAVSTISVTTLSGLELLDEQSFTKMLCLERKRTERSGRRFVLVLVDVTAVLRSGGKQSQLQPVCERTGGIHARNRYQRMVQSGLSPWPHLHRNRRRRRRGNNDGASKQGY